jgi:inactivated superfamily I helicase
LLENDIDPEKEIKRAMTGALALIGQLVAELEKPQDPNNLAALVPLLQEQGENLSTLMAQIEGIERLLEARCNA